MDKKIGIIITGLVIAVVALIGYAFVADTNDPYIVSINDVNYEKQDFENYYKIRYVEEKNKLEEEETAPTEETEEGEDTQESKEEEPKEVNKDEVKDTAWNEWLNAVYLNQIASTKGYKPSEDLDSKFGTEYDAEDFDRDSLTSLGITREDYIKAKKTIEMSNDFYGRLDEYYPIADSVVDDYIKENSDEMRGIDFRVMLFNITSTEATTDEEGNEVPATSNKDEVVAKAEEILEKAKNGEDFEKLAEENEAGGWYSLVSGKMMKSEIESVDIPYLENDLMFGYSDLATPIKELKEVGEYTEVIVTDSYAAFAKLEGKREGVTDETKEALRKELAEYYAQNEIQSMAPVVITNNRILKAIEI